MSNNLQTTEKTFPKGGEVEVVVKTRTTSRVKMVIGLVGTLVVLSTVSIFTYFNVNKLEKNENIIEQTLEVIEHVALILSSLSDSETGQRGYLLTGELKYLEPYNSGVFSVGKEVDEVKTLTEDNPNQQERIIVLQELIEAKKEELQETVDLKEQGKGEEAIVIVLSDRGKDIMDDIRDVIREMKREEEGLLASRRAELEKTQDFTRTILLFGTLLGAFFTLFVSFFIVKSSDPDEST